MPMYQQTAPSQSRSGADTSVWALIAVIVVLVCGVAGWAIARQDVPGTNEVNRTAALAVRNGELAGTREGIAQGARVGRQEANLRTKQQVAAARAQATREGYAAGITDGRARAQARANGDTYFPSGAGAAGTGAYPTQGYEDVLASDLLNDEPGYASSAYPGYGTTASTSPYTDQQAFSTSIGDDPLGF